MCKFVFGRSCNKLNGLIPEDIYNDLKKCEFFASISDNTDFEEDKCCSESKIYENYEKIYTKNEKNA